MNPTQNVIFCLFSPSLAPQGHAATDHRLLRREALHVRLLQQVLQARGPFEAARAHSHRRPAVRVSVLREGVPPESRAQPACTAAHRREALHVRALRGQVQTDDHAEAAHAEAPVRDPLSIPGQHVTSRRRRV